MRQIRDALDAGDYAGFKRRKLDELAQGVED
jgi:hypothetical protein